MTEAHSRTGQQVLVTGATGFLGGALARRLANDGVQVRALVRSPEKAAPLRALGIEVAQGELNDAAAAARALAGCQLVFHSAAAMSGDYAKQRVVNVAGTRTLLEAARAAGVQRLVHVSTISVYGYTCAGDQREDQPPNPGSNPYAVSKAETEQVVIGSGIPYTIVRPGMIYGAGAVNWTRVLFRLAKLKPTPFVGSGTGTAFPIYVDDVVDLLITVASHPAAANQIFNCAPDPAPTWREFLGAYSRLAGHDRWLPLPPFLFAPLGWGASLFAPPVSERRSLRDQAGFLQRSVTYKMDKARDLLGWQPQVDLETGVSRCVPWLREQGLLS